MPQSSEHSRGIWRRLLIAGLVAVFSGLVGELYGYIFYPEQEADYYIGFRIGASIGLISTLIEMFYIRSQRRSWIRRVAFFPGLIVRILVLTAIVRICLVANIALTSYLARGNLTVDAGFYEQLRDTLISMMIVIVIVIMSQLTSVVGVKRFFHLVIGRYFRPVEEDRVFLFVDMVGSSELANKLGNVRFHELLSELFYQIDQAIVSTGGEIVSYVGDSAIVTWPITNDWKKNARALRAVQTMLQRLDQQSDMFERDFGHVPKVRAAIHGGAVVVGECGDSRRQVTFLGDVVNMTARLEEMTKREDEPFLISDKIADLMHIPEGIELQPLGERVLRGAIEPISISRLVLS